MSLLRAFRPRNIVVLRALPLGQMLCAVPALRALRTECPRASITLVGLPSTRSLCDRLSHYIDDFVPFPGFPGLPEQSPHPPAFARFILEMRSRTFDLAVQMHGDGHISNRVTRLLGARRIAGFRRGDEAPDEAGARTTNAWLRYIDRGHEIRRLLALTHFLGCEERDETLEFPLLAGDLAELRDSGLARGLAPGRYVCLHPGTGAARWPAAHFAAVADALHETHGLSIVVIGSPHEREACAALRARMRAPAVDAVSPMSVGAQAALLGDARLLVAGDSELSQLASALHVPSVTVFTASDPSRWAALEADLHRSVLPRDGDGPQAVLAHVQELMAQGRAQEPSETRRPSRGAHRARAGAP